MVPAHPSWSRRPVFVLALLATALAIFAASHAERTSAAFPGKDGLIVTFTYDFESDPETQNIITIDPESGETQRPPRRLDHQG